MPLQFFVSSYFVWFKNKSPYYHQDLIDKEKNVMDWVEHYVMTID